MFHIPLAFADLPLRSTTSSRALRSSPRLILLRTDISGRSQAAPTSHREGWMAVELASAIDKGDLKKLLMKSKKEPVNCAVGMGDGKKSQPGLILLDRVKAPKAVLKELEKQFPGATNTRWGSVFVDTDLDAALVQLQLNKAASGIGKRLVKSLKGTG